MLLLPPFNLPTPLILLITDQLSAPADFLLHKSVQQYLKPSQDPAQNHRHNGPGKVTVLSVSESLARWKAVASRANVALDQHISTRSIEFIDVLSHASPSSQSNTATIKPTLKPIFDLVLQSLDAKNDEKLVILDDVSALEWIGFEFVDIARFVRAVRAACIKANASFIVRHHKVSGEPDDDLFSHLYQLCTYHLEVRGLSSGRSGSVSGEVSLHAGPATVPKNVNLLPRSCAVQYRLMDASVVFFEKGMGEAVL